MSDDIQKRMIKATLTLLVCLSSLIYYPSSAFAAQSLIRDAEIEHSLRTMAAPIFQAADLTPENVKLFIVQDKSINAFVAGGANIFIHTGLLDEMTTPPMLLGVIAHETGHIAGGHLARGSEQLRGATMGAILSYVLAAGAAAAGSPDASMAVLTGGQHLINRNMLSFSRANENSADQAALSYLDSLKITSGGMLSTFQLLRRNENRQFRRPDPYAVTHPLSADRMEAVRAHVERAGLADDAYPKEYDLMLKRIRAKLYAFIEMPPRTFARYPQSDTSIPARMARAIAWYKIPELDKALKEVDGLLADFPRDAFFYDLKGQILFENGRLADALAAYEKSVQLAPDSALLLTSLGEARLANNDARGAVDALERANRIDSTNGRAWRLLAGAYGKLNDNGMSHLALAEEAALRSDAGITRREAQAALNALLPGAPARLRAEDLKRLAADLKEEEDER